MTPSNTRAFIEKTMQILGDKNMLTPQWALEASITDFWPLLQWRHIYQNPPSLHGGRILPLAVLLPQTPQQVAQLVRLAREHRVGLRPAGAGSGVLGALSRPSPKPYAIVDLSRLRTVEWSDEDAGIVKAGAGLVWSELEAWLRERGRTTGHYPQSMELATVGGLVSTASSGSHSSGYGNIEEVLRGARVVTGEGRLLELPPVVREPLPPPLRRLLVGSEGRLAIIVEAHLQTHLLPPCVHRQAYLAPRGFAQALSMLKSFAQAGPHASPAFSRAWDEYEAALENLSQGRWGAVVALEYPAPCGVHEALGRWAEEQARAADLEPLGGRVVEDWMHSRLRFFEKIAKLIDQGLWFETLEIGVTWGRIKEAYERVRQALLDTPGVISATAHAGHAYPGGAALYYTILVDASQYDRAYPQIWETATRAALEAGAQPLHHHGVGQAREPLPRGEPDLLEKSWRALKMAWDPHNVLV